MNNVTDESLVALVGAGVGPDLEHLEFRGESAYFQFNCWCFSVVVVASSPSYSAWIVLLIFGVYPLVSIWVGCHQGAVLPEGVVVCCLCASVLVLRLVWCGRVGCMRVTELGFLRVFSKCVLGELGLLLSVDSVDHYLVNLMCVVVCGVQG